jgi:hypothetical protein
MQNVSHSLRVCPRPEDPKRTFINPATVTGFDDFEVEVV